MLGEWQLCLLNMKIIAELLFYVIQNLPLRTMKFMLSVWRCGMEWMVGHIKLTGGGTKWSGLCAWSAVVLCTHFYGELFVRA